MSNKPYTQITDEMVKDFLKKEVFFKVSEDQVISRWEEFKATHVGEGRDWEIVAYLDEEIVTDVPESRIIKKTNLRWNMAVVKDFPIHSIRRLSDNSVFSLGNKIESVNRFIGHLGQISGFKIINGELGIETENYLLQLKEIREAPIPEQKPVTKPPIGIIPEWLWKEQRLTELRDAIKRYCEANEAVPISWIAEEYGLRGWLENHTLEIQKRGKQ